MKEFWKDMSAILTDGRNGDWSIEHYLITENNIRAMFDGIPIGEYVRLTHRGKCVMSNTPMEKRTNSDFVVRAHGDVLIGGLGIGMIILPIQEGEDVRSITVLEKSREVIDLVKNQLPLNKKVNVVNADVFACKPQNGKRFDCIYMDIWDGINTEIYKNQMIPLKRRYGHYLKKKDVSPRRFNKCWAEWNAKTGHRLF